MRALYFTKIDYIRTKQQMIIAPVIMLLVSTVILHNDPGESKFNAVTLFVYMIFVSIVFSTAPFGECRRKDAGFLMLLPAATRDRVVGRFLYGISMIMIAVIIGIICVIGYQTLGYRISPADLSVCLIGVSVGILLMTAEYVFFYLFGENQGTQLLGIARVLPGMCYFMGAVFVSGMLADQPELQVASTMQMVISLLNVISLVSVAVALIALVAAMALCVRMTERRDY